MTSSGKRHYLLDMCTSRAVVFSKIDQGFNYFFPANNQKREIDRIDLCF